MKLFFKVILFLLFCFYLFILTQTILFKFVPINAIIHHPLIVFSNHRRLDAIISYITFKDISFRLRSINLIPFKTITFYLFADISLGYRIENLAGNIIGFMPFGFILPVLSKRFFKFKTITLATFSLSLTYETLQLLFGFGSFDVDDLILNTLGGILGYFSINFIYLLITSTLMNFKKSKSVNLFNNIGRN